MDKKILIGLLMGALIIAGIVIFKALQTEQEIRPPVELTITELTVTPEKVPLNEEMKITFTVINETDEEITRDIELMILKVMPEPDLVEEYPVEEAEVVDTYTFEAVTLVPGASKPFIHSWIAYPLGDFTVTVGDQSIDFQVLDMPTLIEAEGILTESIQNTLELDSFTTTSNSAFKIKDGEIVLYKFAMEDAQMSVTDLFDFVEQDSKGIFRYSVLMNFSAIADFIERVKTPEELGNLRAMLKDMFGIDMDILVIMRELEEANVSATIEMKTIDFDSYIKIVEVEGLREIVRDVVGIPAADIVMGYIEPHLGVWYKMPVDPEIDPEIKEEEEAVVIFENMKELIVDVFDVFYVRKVLPNTEVNTEVNGIPTYNFVLGLDLDELKNVVITSVSLLVEEIEMDIEEQERIIAEIEKYWPKVVEVVEAAMEIDAETYICQESRFIIKDTITVNINLHELVLTLDSIIREEIGEMAPEDEAMFARIKEVVKDISIVMTMDMEFSDHNAVPEILPPEEYEVIEPEPPFDPNYIYPLRI